MSPERYAWITFNKIRVRDEHEVGARAGDGGVAGSQRRTAKFGRGTP
jgi:hypothetical protein